MRNFASFFPNPTGASNGLLTNLVAYYKLDEASSDALDASGNSKTFTIGGVDPGTASGVISTSRTFNGFTQKFDRATDSAFSPGSSSFVVAGWVKPSNLSQTTYPGIFNKLNTQKEWGLIINGSNMKPSLYVTSDGSTDVNVDATLAFSSTAVFMFLIAGWDGTNLMISQDGGAFATAAFAGPVFAGSSVISIGDRAANFFAGAIDELGFWKGRAPTTAMRDLLYNSGAGRAFSTFS